MKTEHLLTAMRLACVLALILGGCNGSDDGNGTKTDSKVTQDKGQQGDGSGAATKMCLPFCETTEDCRKRDDDTRDLCVNHSCVSCQADRDCTFGPKKCDTTKGLCICKTDDDCSTVGIHKCNVETGLCRTCEKDADCTTVPNKCNLSTGRCIQCTVDSDCVTKQEGKYCLGARCIECKADADCANAHYKGCNTSAGICNLCRSDNECCYPVGACGQTCDTAKGQCHCTNDSQCPKEPNFPFTTKCLQRE